MTKKQDKTTCVSHVNLLINNWKVCDHGFERSDLCAEIIIIIIIIRCVQIFSKHGLGGANPAVNTPRPSRGTRIESCDFIVLIGDP